MNNQIYWISEYLESATMRACLEFIKREVKGHDRGNPRL